MTKHTRTRAVVALAVSAALTLAGCSKNEEEQQQAQETSSTTTAAPSTRNEQNREEDVTPGARIGVDQRSWPDPFGMFDDSAHSEPGEWSVDYLYQRPVWTPVNFEGDLPPKSELVDGGFEQCAEGNVTLAGETQQQYVYGRYLAVNNEAGPSRMENGVPAGFAHSPQGAVMLALNASAYGAPGGGDEVGDAVDDAWWSTYEPLQKKKSAAADYDRSSRRVDLAPPAGFYNVVECSEDVVVVEIGMDFTVSGGEAISTTIPIYWKDGKWVPDVTGTAGTRFDKGGTFDPENPAPFKEVRYE
ncbi:hypothetical protein KBX18_11645 [Corynebacterium sp. CCUG 69979]|uniref:hypothetical protein n=1 Tax=Corynebacterium sp. CCUG 69979 TaxID=2823890 RepID=UPI00210D7B88|nr:hypothetical protein [Corynebacterium sp. CCUG 69979]MCQ4626189.1 hypothetical protein [Corynebacterium sp. CCUG 69979]